MCFQLKIHYLFFHYDWEEKFDYKSYYLTSNTDDVKNLYLTYAVLNSVSEKEIDEMGKSLVSEAVKINPLVRKLKELQGQFGGKAKTTRYSKTA